MATLKANGLKIATVYVSQGYVRILMSNYVVLQRRYWGGYRKVGKLLPHITPRDWIDANRQDGHVVETHVHSYLLDQAPIPKEGSQ